MKLVLLYVLLWGYCAMSFASYAQKYATQADSINRKNTLTIKTNGPDFTAKAQVGKDSLIALEARLGPGYKDYRIFGYAKPDVRSKKLLLISLFTSDVEGNPFACPFGAYYGTDRLQESNIRLKYLSSLDNFIKAILLKDHKKQTTVYIEKRWINFERTEK